MIAIPTRTRYIRVQGTSCPSLADATTSTTSGSFWDEIGFTIDELVDSMYELSFTAYEASEKISDWVELLKRFWLYIRSHWRTPRRGPVTPCCQSKSDTDEDNDYG
jgi:hypothetical protein